MLPLQKSLIYRLKSYSFWKAPFPCLKKNLPSSVQLQKRQPKAPEGPLSELQEKILLLAHENKCQVDLAQVQEQSPEVSASAIDRARRDLLERGLVEVPNSGRWRGKWVVYFV